MPGVAADPAIGHSRDFVLAPFRGVRFAAERVGALAAVTSPPYDLVDVDDIGALMERSPYNVVRLVLPRDVVAPALGHKGDASAEGRYEHAGETLRHWLAEGVLITDPEPALYVYERRGPDTLQRGLIGGVGLEDDEEAVAPTVLPHEDVFPGPVEDRLRLMRATQANLEPIFLLYEGGGPASDLVDDVAGGAEPPLQELTTDDGVTHRLWAVTAPHRLARVAADLRDRRALIADGHHRYATYQRLRAEHRAPGPWDYGLALLVDSSRYPPRLEAIHRVLPGLPVTVAARKAAAAFRVEEVDGSRGDGGTGPAPASRGTGREPGGELDGALAALAERGRRGGTAFVLAGAGPTVLVTGPDPAQVARAMPPGTSPRWRRLDTSVLHELLIDQIWGIPEGEGSVCVVHHDPYAALARARTCDGTAVIVNPLAAEDVMAIAAGGERVPRKSTSFGPKPPTGLILRTFDAG